VSDYIDIPDPLRRFLLWVVRFGDPWSWISSSILRFHPDDDGDVDGDDHDDGDDNDNHDDDSDDNDDHNGDDDDGDDDDGGDDGDDNDGDVYLDKLQQK
jgi:hypothetical protein